MTLHGLRPWPRQMAGLSADAAQELSAWMKETLKARVSEVATTERLVDSPAIISDHDNAVTRRMMQVTWPPKNKSMQPFDIMISCRFVLGAALHLLPCSPLESLVVVQLCLCVDWLSVSVSGCPSRQLSKRATEGWREC